MTGTHYPRLREIGVGGFGTVFQSIDAQNVPVAVKHIPASKVESESKRLVREIDILNQLSARDHPCVLRIDDAFLTVPNDDPTHQLFNVNLVMPLYSSDLHKYARNVDALYTRAAAGDAAAQRQLIDMASHAPYLAFRATAGMDFVHKCGLVHRDMKPDNVMIALAPAPRNTLAVIGDFGLARAATATETFYTCTRQYRPPEVITNTAKGNSSMDVWSLGCTFFEMATGHSLFRVPSARDARGAWVPALASGQLEALLDVFGRPEPATIEKVPATNVKSYLMKTRDRPCRVPELVRQNFKLLPPGAPGREELVELWVDLIMRCLRWLPEERPTCKELLQHPLFRRAHCFVVYSDAERAAALQQHPDALVVLEPQPISYKGGATKETKEGNKEKIRLLVQHVNASRLATAPVPAGQQAAGVGSSESLEFPIPTTPRVRSAFADFAALMSDPIGAYTRAAAALGADLTAAERSELDAVRRFCEHLAASAAEDAAQA